MARQNPPLRRPPTPAERQADRLLDCRGDFDDTLRRLDEADDLEPPETLIIRRARRWWQREGVPILRAVQGVAERRARRSAPHAEAA